MKHMQSNIAYSIGKARRNSLTDKEGSKLPGPGIYKDAGLDVVRYANPKWSIKGKGTGQKYTRDVPGPGQYDDGFKKHHSPNYTFGNKLSQTVRQDETQFPGPGTYKTPSTLLRKGGYLGVKVKDHK